MRFLLAFIFLFTQTTWGQTVGKNAEFNSVSGADYYTNFVINESAKKNAANTVTSNATVARGTTNKIDNVASFTVDASAQNGYVEFTLGTVYDPATSGNCEFKGVFKGDGTLYKAQIVDGSGNLLNQTPVLTNETNWRAFSVTYPCAASGSRKVRITQTESGTAPAFSVGKLYYGQITNLQAGVPNNTFVANISSASVVSNENEDFISGNCTFSSPTYTCTFVTSKFTVAPICSFQHTAGASSIYAPFIQTLNTTQIVYGFRDSTGTATSLNHLITCTRASTDFIQPAITPAQWAYNWRSYTPNITASSGTLTNYTLSNTEERRDASGKLWIRGTLSFTGSPGTWSIPRIGIPSGLSISVSQANMSGVLFGDAGSNSYEGAARVSSSTSYVEVVSLSGTNGAGIAMDQSSPFTWAINDTISWTVGPIDISGWNPSQNAPQLVGSVTSDFSGALRTVSGIFAGSTESTNCTTTPCTVHRDYGGISSVTRSFAGSYTANFSKAFSSLGPVCTCSCLENGVAFRSCTATAASTTNVGLICQTGELSPTGKDATVMFNCSGPR